MELIPSRRSRDSLNYSNSSYLVYNVTRALDGIKAGYLPAVCLLFLVNSVCVCLCVCVSVCVCVRAHARAFVSTTVSAFVRG